MTVDEAYEELLKRGFDKFPCTYRVRLATGEYTDSIVKSQEPLTKYTTFIDCGVGYLWSRHTPNNLHEGTQEYLAAKKVKSVTTFEELLAKL